MVGIKNFDMPYNCYDCELHNYHECNLTSESIEDDYCWNGDSREKHCPLVEAIPKDQYEARLKADLKAILVELKMEIEEIPSLENECEYAIDECIYKYRVTALIQEKISLLKAEVEPQESEDEDGTYKP